MITHREEELIQEQRESVDRLMDSIYEQVQEETLLPTKPEQGTDEYIPFIKEWALKVNDLYTEPFKSYGDLEKEISELLGEIEAYEKGSKFYWQTLGILWALEDFKENII